MSVDYTRIYKFDNNFESFERDNTFLYMNYDDVNWFRTNETGKSIISECNGECTLDEIIAKFAAKNGFSEETLKSMFDEYIENAIVAGVIYDIKTGLPSNERLAQDKDDHIGDDIVDLWIHVSGRCNLNCPFCYSQSGINNQNELDYKQVLSFLEQLKEEKRHAIVISGGEPFLYKDLVPLVKGLRELKYNSILIITNGTVGEEKYEEVIPYIDGIQVSVDGTVAEIHDISRGKGSFDKMVKNLALLRNSGLKRLIISFTPTVNNINELPQLPKFVYDNRVDAVHITRLMPIGRGHNSSNTLSVEPELYKEKMKAFVENLNKIERIIDLENELKKSNRDLISVSFAGDQSYKIAYKQKKLTCGAGLGSMSIYHDGNIYPCASLHNEEFSFGTIYDNVDKIIKNAQDFMRKVSVDNLPGCKDCKFRYMCGGGCRACAYGSSKCNSIYDQDPMCEKYKHDMFETAWVLNRPTSSYGCDTRENPMAD